MLPWEPERTRAMFDPTTPTRSFTPRVMAAGVVDRIEPTPVHPLGACGNKPLAGPARTA